MARALLALTGILACMAAAPAAARADSPTIKVRSGDHPGFSRIVFDWPRAVAYKVESAGGQATVRFAATAPIDAAALAKLDLRHVRKATAQLEGKGQRVDLVLGEGTEIHHFLAGSKVVIDVRATTARAQAQKQPQVQAQAQIQEENHGPMHVAAPAPAGASTPILPLPAAPVTAVEETAAPPAAAPVHDNTESAVPEAAPRAPVESAPLAPKRLIPEGLSMSIPRPAPAPAPANVTRTTQLAAVEHGSPVAEAVPAAAAKPEPAMPPPAKAPSVLSLRLEREGEHRILILDWDGAVAAAVFRYGGQLWLVFDRAGRLEQPAGQIDGMPAIERVALAGAMVLRLPWPEEAPIAFLRRDTAWHLHLDAREASAVESLPTQVRSASETGTRLLLAVNAPGEPVDLKSVLDGDPVVAVPIAAPGRGVAGPRDFVQFALLPTAQGIVVRAKSDGVRVGTTARGATIDAGSGLLLSGIGDGDRHLALRVEEWRRGGRDRYRDHYPRLQNAISDAPATERAPARRALAEFQFAHGLYPEALAVMERVAEDDPSVTDDGAFRLMRGVARLRLGRIEEAAAELDPPSLGDSPEAALWRGMLATERRLWVAAQKAFAAGVYVVDRYPPDLRAQFRLAMARTWIELKDARSARAELAALKLDQASTAERAMANLAHGRAAALAGEAGEAKKHFREAIASGDRRARPWAEMALVDNDLATGAIDKVAAIEGLERLRFAWRGDEFEFRLLDRLGNLHLDAGHYREGFSMLREAVDLYPREPRIAAISQRLRAEFAKLFFDGEADRLPPLVALGLFYDFREFTPTGSAGDRMIGRLADRLMESDLLDRATELMEHLVNERLAGPEKARVGARLTVAYLLDRKPEPALKALRASAAPGTPPALLAERRVLEARALAETGRYVEAIAAIGGDNDSVAMAARADIHWRAKDWPAAATSLEAMLGARDREVRPLEAGERRQVLQLVVALALAGEAARLEKTRERYVKAMDGTAEAEAFAVVTSRNDHRESHPLRLASAIARIDQLEAFMTSYRKKLAAGKTALN